MSPTEVGEVVDAAVRRLRRKRAPVEDWGDLAQEGWRIALSALRSADPARNPRGYVYVAVLKELGNYTSRNLAAVSIGGNWKHAREVQHRVDVDALGALRDPGPTPEDEAEDAERAGGLARWRIDLRRVLDRALDDEERPVAERLLGLDGLPTGRPREIARALGVPVRAVYRVRGRLASLASGDVGAWRLGRRLAELDR